MRKRCSRCKKVKTIDQFHKNKTRSDGVQGYCKECRPTYRRQQIAKDPDYNAKAAAQARKWRAANPERYQEIQRRSHEKNYKRYYLETKYGLSVSEYEEMLLEGCGICGGFEKLCVDHDHETGLVRGILCDNCNVGIGRLNDDPKLIEKALRYLWKANPVSG